MTVIMIWRGGIKLAGIGHDGHLLQPDWDPGGSIPDSGGSPKRCDVTDPGPVMVSLTAGVCVYIMQVACVVSGWQVRHLECGLSETNSTASVLRLICGLCVRSA